MPVLVAFLQPFPIPRMKKILTGESAVSQHHALVGEPHIALASISSAGAAATRPAMANAARIFFISILRCYVSKRFCSCQMNCAD